MRYEGAMASMVTGTVAFRGRWLMLAGAVLAALGTTLVGWAVMRGVGSEVSGRLPIEDGRLRSPMLLLPIGDHGLAVAEHEVVQGELLRVLVEVSPRIMAARGEHAACPLTFEKFSAAACVRPADARRYADALTAHENRMRHQSFTPCYGGKAEQEAPKPSCTGYRLPNDTEWRAVEDMARVAGGGSPDAWYVRDMAGGVSELVLEEGPSRQWLRGGDPALRKTAVEGDRDLGFRVVRTVY
jgi:hypothetical protein